MYYTAAVGNEEKVVQFQVGRRNGFMGVRTQQLLWFPKNCAAVLCETNGFKFFGFSIFGKKVFMLKLDLRRHAYTFISLKRMERRSNLRDGCSGSVSTN